jgi:hypothetical protein
MAATVHNYDAGDVVSITSQKGFYTEEFGEINKSNPGGPGLLRLNPGIETKYSICFIAPEGEVDTTECIWIPIPNTTGVMAVQGYNLSFPIPPTDEGVNMLRGMFQKARSAVSNVFELGSPSPREAREQRDAPSDTKRMYITDEGMQAFDNEYTRKQERVNQLKGPERLQASQRIRQERAEILAFITLVPTDKEVHAKFGDSEFHRMKAEGHWTYNIEDWTFYESDRRRNLRKEYEETKEHTDFVKWVADSSGQDLYDLEGPESVFVAGEETSETRPYQDTDLAVSEPEVSTVEEPIVSTEVSDSSGPKASRNGKRALGNLANLGRSFAIGKLAQTGLGEKIGLEVRTHRLLAHIPIETAVVFLSDMPELGVEKNDKGTVKLGPRGREKVVYFGEGEYVVPKQNTILGIATSAPTQATSVSAITGKWGATTPSSMGQFLDSRGGFGSSGSLTSVEDGLPPGFNAEYYADLSPNKRNEYLRSFKIDVGHIGTTKERNARPGIERKIAARLRRDNQRFLTPEEAEQKRKNKAPKPPSTTVIRESMIKVVFDDETDRWVALIIIPSDRVPSTAVAPEGIDMENTSWRPITPSERNKVQNVIEEWKRLNPSKIPNYEIRDKLQISSQERSMRDISGGSLGMDRRDIDNLDILSDLNVPDDSSPGRIYHEDQLRDSGLIFNLDDDE